MADTPELGRALAEFAAACSLMAEPSNPSAAASSPEVEDAVPAFLGRATEARGRACPDPGRQRRRAPIDACAATRNRGGPARTTSRRRRVPAGRAASQSPLSAEDTVMELERRLGLRGPES